MRTLNSFPGRCIYLFDLKIYGSVFDCNDGHILALSLDNLEKLAVRSRYGDIAIFSNRDCQSSARSDITFRRSGLRKIITARIQIGYCDQSVGTSGCIGIGGNIFTLLVCKGKDYIAEHITVQFLFIEFDAGAGIGHRVCTDILILYGLFTFLISDCVSVTCITVVCRMVNASCRCAADCKASAICYRVYCVITCNQSVLINGNIISRESYLAHTEIAEMTATHLHLVKEPVYLGFR